MPEIFSFTTPKKGHETAENEDAIFYRKSRGLFALADGATEGFDSRRWATLLASQWIREPRGLTGDLEDFESFVLLQAKTWARKWEGSELPWYSEAKFAQGSFATFLGLHLDEDRSRFSVIAVGDCCLFVFNRDKRRVLTFPLDSKDDFNNSPTLIPSVAGGRSYVLRRREASLAQDSIMIMMSDAIAAWFLGANESFESRAGQVTLWNALESKDRAMLQQLIDEERLAGRMKNDDVSILFLTIKGA